MPAKVRSLAAGEGSSMLLAGLRESVLRTALEMERLGLTRGTSGNVSARDPGSGLIAITPSGLPYTSLAPAHITVVDLDGKVVEGDRKPSSETPMHCAVYRATARGIHAIVHTHSPFATALSVMNRELPVITVPLALIGRVPVVPFRLPGSPDLASAVAAVVEQGNPCCLLQNHGLICAGPSLEKALESAVYIEEGAQAAIYVLGARGELTPIPDSMVKHMRMVAREGRLL